MNLSPQKREHIRWFYRVGLSLLVPVLTFVLTIMSLIMENESGIVVGNSIRKAAFVVALVAAAGQFAASMFKHMTKKNYLLMCRQEALSKATLLAQQKSNEAKTRNILQLPYGRVPEWRPFDFRKNVLVYDIHEQLRTLLVEIRDSVLMLSDETDSDKVTVDLVYRYPDDTYSGRLPEPSLHYGNEELGNAWRLITSGDASCINYTLHDFLRSNESFFFRLDQENFVFINDKKTVSRYYIPSGKDQEYDGVGSIAGMTINIKNDAPESVLVKAMLTITTYGWNLLDKKSLIKEAEYREIFKQNVLNGHKSLLESELAQMYIRHAIKDGNMCPYTGARCKTSRPIEKDEDGNAPGATDTKKDNAAFQSAYEVRTAQECFQCPIMQKACAIQSSCPL
jgi:hypothetical protein